MKVDYKFTFDNIHKYCIYTVIWFNITNSSWCTAVVAFWIASMQVEIAQPRQN